MRNSLRTSVILAAAALAALAPAHAQEVNAAEAEQRSFTLSTNPEEVVLRYRHGGGMEPSVVYTLYGDGRLVHERVKEAAKQVSDHVEMQLGFLERVELIRLIVDAGFRECGPACSQKRCAELRGVNRIPRTPDCGGVDLTIKLESYQGPGDSEPRALQRREYLDCPSALVTYYCTESELPEVQGLRELGKALHKHKNAAQEAEP